MLCKFWYYKVPLITTELFCYHKNVVTLAKLFVSMTAIIRTDAFEVWTSTLKYKVFLEL